MSHRLLVPLDGSDLAEQVLPYANALAGADGQLILLEVGDVEDDCGLPERHGDSASRLECVTGDPAAEIVRVAQDLRVDLIAMTTRGGGAAGPWSLGRVIGQVVQTSPLPLLVVRPREGAAAPALPVIRRLVVPLDGSPLAEDALPVALALAQPLGLPIHLVTVAGAPSAIPRANAESMVARVGERFRREGIAISTEVLQGEPFAAIAGAAQPGDVLVMAGQGRSAQRWFLDGVAEKLIREAPTPVVLVPTGKQRDERGTVDDAVPAAPTT